MTTSVSLAAYLEPVRLSIHVGELAHEPLCELLFAIVDGFCHRLPERSGPGRPPTYPTRTILKIAMLMHLTGTRGETAILRTIKRHYRRFFPQLPAQPRLWQRLHAAGPLLEQFRQHLRQQLDVDSEQIRIVDTLPIPVQPTSARRGRANGFVLAERGYCASKKLWYSGYKLGLIITPQGIPDVYDLFPAQPHDSTILDDLVTKLTKLLLLGDKGFISEFRRMHLAQVHQVWLITYRRCNQKQQNTWCEQRLLNTYRRRIETVFSQLVTHMHLQDTWTKTDDGLAMHLAGALTAFTLGMYINALLGRDWLAIKELFA